MHMTATEVQEWTCPNCGLIIKSIYPGQFDYNVRMHKRKHEKR